MNSLLFAAVLTLWQAPPLALVSVQERSFTAERVALYATAAADVLTTRLAIRNGAYEGNALLTPIIGKTPSTLKLIGVKAVAVGAIELSAWVLRKHGHVGQARSSYWVPVVRWGVASGANLRFVW